MPVTILAFILRWGTAQVQNTVEALRQNLNLRVVT